MAHQDKRVIISGQLPRSRQGVLDDLAGHAAPADVGSVIEAPQLGQQRLHLRQYRRHLEQHHILEGGQHLPQVIDATGGRHHCQAFLPHRQGPAQQRRCGAERGDARHRLRFYVRLLPVQSLQEVEKGAVECAVAQREKGRVPPGIQHCQNPGGGLIPGPVAGLAVAGHGGGQFPHLLTASNKRPDDAEGYALVAGVAPGHEDHRRLAQQAYRPQCQQICRPWAGPDPV